MISTSSIIEKVASATCVAHVIFHDNAGILFMLAAQTCSTILATLGRILRTERSGGSGTKAVGTSEILIAMMLIVTILSWTYMLRCSASIPGGAFGPTKLRPLLVIRGIAGFFGIWGFYVSLRYLALAEATLINFLAPVLATLLLGLLPGQQRCSMTQILAALVAVIGLLCVLQPWSAHVTNTPREHALAIGAALVGVLGGAVSFLTMSCLGEHVHPITTVAYFAPICTLLSGTSLIIQRQGFSFPSTTVQWLFVCVLGVIGFAMHCLMAASLMTGDSKRALHIVYVQVVFAMLADKIVWGLEPGWWKYTGAVLIMGSAMFVAATKRSQGYTLVGEVDEEEKIETVDANH